LIIKRNAVILILLITLIASCDNIKPYRVEEALGTYCVITLYEKGKSAVYNDIFSKIRNIENLMSVNIKTSDISRINDNAGIEKVLVDRETFKVIERALFFAELSGGAFDPTVGPLVTLWGIGRNARVPSQEEIDEILPLINWRNVELDAQAGSVFLKQRGMALDLGAIAKGYAADEAANAAKNYNIKRALIDLGGNIAAVGTNMENSPWRVGIQNPFKERGESLGYLQVTDKTVVTSGVYERYFTADGKNYHHIFSPENGYPAQTGLLSVTIITGISMDADALSTALFVMGFEDGIKLLETMPQMEAVFVFEDKSIRTTGGVKFTLLDETFSLRK